MLTELTFTYDQMKMLADGLAALRDNYCGMVVYRHDEEKRSQLRQYIRDAMSDHPAFSTLDAE